MNIMLATVTERTREIGIRRALGAKQRDIVYQFLVETIVLTITGGVLGMVFGFLCKPVVAGVQSLIRSFLPDVWDSFPPTIAAMEPIIAPWSIIAAVGISAFVGIVFGLYPAFRAARMDPIEALRHE
jgi:ABC-type antimicrobial peptide transport system permease subunit